MGDKNVVVAVDSIDADKVVLNWWLQLATMMKGADRRGWVK
jgi:hypothetical protein